ncbi:hypothetical protein GCM10017674_46560 [Streptomyces gardneri]|uniref:Chaplin domain-containing protein n=1 Tax=Streptomyces gardneri TaxID=66892 RepID=A0A4Y3RRQ3_9ACTN|nr:hypothetical protein SGA01_41850 [Streptomyces gardneri]GHH06348.1 hypothetical protein GCM10017674_46560 [Streptomyces gardneri]
MRIRITSAVACLALTIAGLTVAAGSAAAVEQGEGQSAGQRAGLHGESQWPVPVPPEVGELICEIQANLPHMPHLVPVPHCKPVNGWQ